MKQTTYSLRETKSDDILYMKDDNKMHKQINGKLEKKICKFRNIRAYIKTLIDYIPLKREKELHKLYEDLYGNKNG